MIEEIEEYARNNNIPIMEKSGIAFLCSYIKEHNIKSILEIGSAIGYSAIMMASVNNDIKITTLEKDIERYEKALENIKNTNLSNNIEILNIDALTFETDRKFDLIFIDAAKGKNRLFFEKFTDNLNKNGVIITDNLGFHGLVNNENLIKTKNQKAIVRKIKDYIVFLKENPKFITEFFEVGDTIAISRRCIDENSSNT